LKGKKMKKTIIASVLFGGLLIANSANAALIDKATESKLVNICHALQSDSKIKLHTAMKKSGISYRSIAKDLQCNGQDAISFALTNGADTTAQMMAKRAHVDVEPLLAIR
jgi:hypothetical protein